MNLSRILVALAAVAGTAGTGVMLLDVSDGLKAAVVFAASLVGVFLASITSTESAPARVLLKLARKQ